MAHEHTPTAPGLAFGLRNARVPTILFLGGVFLTFAPLMYLTMRTEGPVNWSALLIAFTISGFCAIFWAMGGILNPRWFFVAVPMQFVAAFVIPSGLLGNLSLRPSGLDPVGLLSVLCIALGYVCFCVVIIGYARRAIAMAVEMDLAAQIHRHLVPSIEIETDRYELAAESKPSGAMGGDVLHAVALPDGSIEAAVADVSGHGVRAGVVMAMVKATIESARDRSLGASGVGGAGRSAGGGAARGEVDGRRLVHDIACELNRVLHALTEPDMFVTAAILHADRDGRVHAVIAAHPPALRRTEKSIEQFGAPGLPLGVVPDFEPESITTQLGPGDSLVLYSDGLTEAIVRAAGAAKSSDAAVPRLGVDGLVSIVRATSPAPAEQVKGIFAGVASAAQSDALDDDRSVLVLRRRG